MNVGEMISRIIRKMINLFGISQIPHNKIKKFLKTHNAFGIVSNRKTLAVIIPCFNHAKYLSKTLESLEKQTKLPDEIIFINDNSPDNTNDVIEKFKVGNAIKTKILKNPYNEGQANSINKGILVSESDLIMILNDDDYLFSDAIEKMFKILNNKKEIFLLGCSSVHFTNDEVLDAEIKSNTSGFDIKIFYPNEIWKLKKYNDLNMTHSSSVFVREAWKAAGGYIKESTKRIVPFSDRDFQLRMAALFPVGILKDPLVFWRSNSSVDSGLNS